MPTRVIIRKGWNTRDERNSWVNTYEFLSSAAPGDAPWDAVVQNLIDAERIIHLTGVLFISATISTWTPDSKPYNPAAFRTIPLNVAGAHAPGAGVDALDSNVCYYVRKQVATGRQGKFMYRGCLVEGDVQPRGDLAFELVPGTQMAPGGTAFTAYRNEMLTTIGDVMSDGGGGLALVAQYEPGGPVVSRLVTDIVPGGVTINRRNHRYFDRA